MTAHSSIAYCRELVREHDRKRYLCAVCAPAPMRDAWCVLFAFYHEIAHISHVVGEEMVGFVRYAWWREAMGGLYAGKAQRGHPVMEALAEVVRDYTLPQPLFIAIIDAHEAAMADKKELDVAFMEATSIPLMQLCACVAEGGDEVALAALAVAWAAMEAACLPQMDAGHRPYFMTLARERLALTGQVGVAFQPFLRTIAFYLKRLEKGWHKRILSAHIFWLPLALWRTKCFRRQA